MKIEVAKPDLSAAIQVANIGALSSGTDLTSHFVFRCREDNQIEILSNNSRIGVSIPIAGCKVTRETDSPDAFTVEAWRLSKWIAAVENAVLTLDFKDGVVSAKSTRGQVKFQSKDPSAFAFWDETFSKSSTGFQIKAKRFHAALSHVRLFISDKDTTTPKLASTEILNESLQATDKGALAVVTIEELKKCTLRIHGKDLGQVLAFLSACGDEVVELREDERCLFIVRPDGGVMSVGRPLHAFPDINLDKKPDDPYWWILKVDDLQSAINALAAAAAKEDHCLNFSFEGGMVQLSMKSVSAEEKSIQMLEAQHGEDAAATVPMPPEGFDVSYMYLVRLLNQWRGETIRFGLNPQLDKKTKKSRGGYVRFREDRDGDDYLTLLVWML